MLLKLEKCYFLSLSLNSMINVWHNKMNTENLIIAASSNDASALFKFENN